jgi:hypothetical protein
MMVEKTMATFKETVVSFLKPLRQNRPNNMVKIAEEKKGVRYWYS